MTETPLATPASPALRLTRRAGFVLGGCSALLLVILIAVSVGAVAVPLHTVWGILAHQTTGLVTPDWTAGREAIVWDIRFPRALLAALVGAGLGITGAALQSVTRNPLADPQVYAAMRAYAPYENLRAEQYPAVLATSSLHDTRVYVTEPAKWVARMREVVTNDPAARPVLLRTELSAGHGGRSGRYAAWEQIAWEWAFVLDQLSATRRLNG